MDPILRQSFEIPITPPPPKYVALVAHSSTNEPYCNKLANIVKKCNFTPVVHRTGTSDVQTIASVLGGIGKVDVFAVVLHVDNNTLQCRQFVNSVRQFYPRAFAVVSTDDQTFWSNKDLKTILMSSSESGAPPDMVTNNDDELSYSLLDLLMGCPSEFRVPTTILHNKVSGTVLLLGSLRSMKSYGVNRMLEKYRANTYFVTCSSDKVEWQDERLQLDEPMPKRDLLGFNTPHLALDSNTPELLATTERFLYLLPDLVQRIDMQLYSKGRNVLIHCAWGFNRSVSVTMAYIMWKQQCSFEEAKSYLQRVQHWVTEPTHSSGGNIAYLKGLQIWHQLLEETKYDLRKAAKISMSFVRKKVYYL